MLVVYMLTKQTFGGDVNTAIAATRTTAIITVLPVQNYFRSRVFGLLAKDVTENKVLRLGLLAKDVTENKVLRLSHP